MDPANTNKNLWVFTPSRTAPEDLEFIFVQRHALLKDTVERVKESVLTKHKHHLLFVGPRGCGKTHFVSLVVHRVIQDQELVPAARIAWLNEDATCNSVREFLLKVYQALAKRYPTQFTEDQIADAYEMKPASAQAYVGRQLLAQLGAGTIVIVMENLDALMVSLGLRGQQEWRAFLQENPRFCIVATAQRLVPELSSREKPFYGFFQTEYLKPLSLDQAMELMHNIAAWRSLPALTNYLYSSVGHARVQALHHLSGGNHRIYLVLSQFVTRDTLDALVPLFMKMLDELTPYYQERLRWLPDQQRMIVEYLCSSELTVPVKQIAKRLFATPQTISSQLQELREKGYVESNQRGRESLYEISEPLMRLIVEVKDNPLSPLPLLVNFLRVWYDDRDLRDHLTSSAENETKRYVSTALERNAKEGSLRQKIFLQGLEATLAEHPNRLVGWSLENKENWSEQKTHALQLHAEGKTELALTYLEEELALSHVVAAKAEMLIVGAGLKIEVGRLDDSIKDYTAVTELPNAPINQVAHARNNRGVTYGNLGQIEKAIADYTAVIELNDVPIDLLAKSRDNRGWAYLNLGQIDRAIADYTAAIELPMIPVVQLAKSRYNRGVVYGRLAQFDRAITDFTAVINLPEVGVEQLARAQNKRGVTYTNLGQFEQAIAEFTGVINLLEAPVEEVATARYNRGVTYWNLGLLDQATADSTAVIDLPMDPIKVVARAHLLRCEIFFLRADWQAGLEDLSVGLEMGKRFQPKEVGWPEDQLHLIFTSGLQSKDRASLLRKMWDIYMNHNLIAELGQGVVAQLGKLYQQGAPFPSAEHLDQWLRAWEAMTNEPKSVEFVLPLRLLRVGVVFLKSGGNDRGILLDLTKPERKILEQAFGIASD